MYFRFPAQQVCDMNVYEHLPSFNPGTKRSCDIQVLTYSTPSFFVSLAFVWLHPN